MSDLILQRFINLFLVNNKLNLLPLKINYIFQTNLVGIYSRNQQTMCVSERDNPLTLIGPISNRK